MQDFDTYCRALGVGPGDGPELVKRAFRARIKQHHPDANRQTDDGHSRLLIEAYAAFKKGVPARPFRPGAGPGPRSGSAGGRTAGTYRTGPTPGAQRAAAAAQGAAYSAARKAGREAARRIFRTIWTPPDEDSPLGDVYVNLSGMIWGDDESTHVYGKHAKVREYVPPRRQRGPFGEDDMPSHPYDQAIEYYTRAEAVLRETVHRFERRSNRFKNSWVRDYIGDLAKVQVLFRDVCKRYPSLSAKSLARVRQISELITEIRNSRIA